MAFCAPTTPSTASVSARPRGQPNAARLLESLYHINNYPTSDAIEMIAQRIHTDYDSVVRWFELRRRQDQCQQQQQQQQHQYLRHQVQQQSNYDLEEDDDDDGEYEEENSDILDLQHINGAVSGRNQQHINATNNLANVLANQNQLTAALANDPTKLLENIQQLLLMCQQQPQAQPTQFIQQQQLQLPQQQFNNNSSMSVNHNKRNSNNALGSNIDSRQVLYPQTNGSSYHLAQNNNNHNSLSSYSPSSSPSEDGDHQSTTGTSGFASKLKAKLASVKKPNNRVFTFSEQQRQILEQLFEANNYLKPGECRQLSEYIQVPSRNIKIWYKNRRSKKRALAKQAPDGLPGPEEFDQDAE